MYLLSIDTSSSWLCVAVSRKENLLAAYCRQRDRSHGTYLVPVIARLVARCGILPRQLNGLAVINGPGSFTGLRIGLATVKGLAMARRLPVAALSSLDLLAAQAPACAPVIVPMIDARRGQVYAAMYRRDTRQQLTRRGPFLLAPPEDIMRRLRGKAALLGDGLAMLSDEVRHAQAHAVFLPQLWCRPQPAVLARLAWHAHAQGNTVTAAALRARYLYRDSCAVRVPSGTLRKPSPRAG